MRFLMLALLALSGVTLVATPPAAAQAVKKKAAPAAKKGPARPAAPTNWTRVIVKTPQGGYRIGNPAARLKLVEYGSRSCPTCGRFAADSGALVTTYVASGRVSWEFRDYPVHAQDIAISMLGRCVPTGSYFKVLEGMFAGQAEFNSRVTQISPERAEAIRTMEIPAQSRAYADELGYTAFMKRNGMTEAAITACLSNQLVYNDLVRIAEGAGKLGVQGTPTFFLNGKRLDGVMWSQIEPLLKPGN
ncbi:thioredoxin domain-containing protein [Sphingomonas sp. AOB5]|uniref:DsbA family protein n=1 Tax=Sphingomonas sp. AOB5 TaxID=3034017 RepID=UPI0023F9E6DD|nr:thioredoxin domain-containing protein [Sphingomonas sp. AOB5]MDF7777447.1 thioredoxin domain-containing protein [Sphingomonas sp. AOB5]